MTDRQASNRGLTDRLSERGQLQDVPRDAFANLHALLIGAGAIGRPLSLQLAALGVRQFTLVDPKRYRRRSTLTQCQPHEVGRHKADVVADLLHSREATVEVFADDIFSVPDGIVRPETVILVSVDNRRGDIGANRLATRMCARALVKANVEPSYDTAAVRVYSPRHDPSRCIECLFSPAIYQRQRHPRSCDGGGRQRSTASPRSLTSGAATLASTALGQLLLGGAAARRWLGREWQFRMTREQLTVSRLTPNPQCGWSHSNCWQRLHRCHQPLESCSLQRLAEASGITVPSETLLVRFCRQVVLQATCVEGAHRVPLVRWVRDLEQPFGSCPACGSPLRASPFFSYERLPAKRLVSVWHRPLTEWGVARQAVIQLQDRRQSRAFVIADTSRAADRAAGLTTGTKETQR